MFLGCRFFSIISQTGASLDGMHHASVTEDVASQAGMRLTRSHTFGYRLICIQSSTLGQAEPVKATTGLEFVCN